VTILAIDGGGTKTAVALTTLEGKVLAQAQTGRSNPTTMTTDQFSSTMTGLLEEIRWQNQKAYDALSYAHAGMSGVTENNNEPLLRNTVEPHLPDGCRFSISNDSVNCLMAGTLGSPGIVQVAGTGAITYSLDERGQEHRTGGWGYLFDDEGSGFDLGIQALKKVFKAYDGRGAATQLTDRLLRHFGVDTVPEMIGIVYGEEEHSRNIVSRLGSYVTELFYKDEEAASIVRQASERFFHSIESCFKKSVFHSSEIPVILAGGVFTDFKLFHSELERLRGKTDYQFRFKPLYMQPVGGAAIAPLKLTAPEAEAFADTFNRSYRSKINQIN